MVCVVHSAKACCGNTINARMNSQSRPRDNTHAHNKNTNTANPETARMVPFAIADLLMVTT